MFTLEKETVWDIIDQVTAMLRGAGLCCAEGQWGKILVKDKEGHTNDKGCIKWSRQPHEASSDERLGCTTFCIQI